MNRILADDKDKNSGGAIWSRIDSRDRHERREIRYVLEIITCVLWLDS